MLQWIQETGKEEIIRCTYLIGCDGAHSTTRALMEVPFEGAPYPEEFVLADIKVRHIETDSTRWTPSALSFEAGS